MTIPKFSLRCRRTILLILLSMLSSLILLDNVYSNDTILSKDHAASIFSMDKDRWNDSIHKMVAAGRATTAMNSQGVERMVVRYGTGAYLYVVPEFETTDEKPSRIHVTLAMPPPMSLMFNQETIHDVTTQAKSQMLPEYHVSTDYESVGGGVALFFIIVED